MDQEVVIGPSTVEFLNEIYEQYNFKSDGHLFMQHLQDDIVCLDSERKLDDLIEEKIYDIGNDLILSLWTEFATNQMNQVRIEVENDKIDSNNIQASLLSKSKDNIWINQNITKDALKVLREVYGKKFANVIDQKRYIKPVKGDIIIRDGIRYSLEPGNTIPITKLLAVCLRDAKKVIIQDGYLVKELPLKNLCQIINKIPDNAQITINTLSDSCRTRYIKEKDDGYSVLGMETTLFKRFKNKDLHFKYSNSKKKLRQRWIKTNKWMIDMGHGLDSYKDSKIISETAIGFELLNNYE